MNIGEKMEFTMSVPGPQSPQQGRPSPSFLPSGVVNGSPGRASPFRSPVSRNQGCRSPARAKLMREVALKSPYRSPLREVLRTRCRERMDKERFRMFGIRRGMESQQPIRDLIMEEAQRFRKTAGESLEISKEEVDEALQDMQLIEEELYAEMGLILADEDKEHPSCPLCFKHILEESSKPTLSGVQRRVVCSGGCGLSVVVTGGMEKLMEEVHYAFEVHSECPQSVTFGFDGNCLYGMCDVCDLCLAIGGE